jgi:Domain of Unknown Function (DUF1259)
MLWVTLLAGLFITASGADLDTAKIDQLTGLKGKMNQAEGAYKVTFPRNDVVVTVDGWKMPPFMGLGTWASFTKGAHAEAMVMGDTVLFEDEVNPAMSVALDSGLSVTALHNHFFFDHPKVYFMHVGGKERSNNLRPRCARFTTKSKKFVPPTRNHRIHLAVLRCRKKIQSQLRRSTQFSE